MLTPKLPLMAAAWRSGCLQKSWIGHDVPVISWTCWRATIRIQAWYPNVFSATCAVHANVCGYVHMQHMLVMRSRVRHPWELSERLGLHFSFSVGPWCVFQTFLGRGGGRGINTDHGGPVRGERGRWSQLDRNIQIEVPVNLTRSLPWVWVCRGERWIREIKKRGKRKELVGLSLFSCKAFTMNSTCFAFKVMVS